MSRTRPAINFARINAAALKALPAICVRLLPDGRRLGGEWVAKNPTRRDETPGSFSINLKSGLWADFATGDGGSDPVSLVAYVTRSKQGEAAKLLRRMLGLALEGDEHD